MRTFPFLVFAVCSILVLSSLLVLGSCNARDSSYGMEKGRMYIERKDTVRVPVLVEYALTAEQRAQGLMYRSRLKDGHGMIFVFASEQNLDFWMKNTLIDLSIAYINANGVIIDIQDMDRLSTALVRSARPAKYALEVPRRWFEKKGIAVGDRLAREDLDRLQGLSAERR